MVGRVTYSGSSGALYGLKVNSLVSGGVKGMESRILAMDTGSAAPAGRAESGAPGRGERTEEGPGGERWPFPILKVNSLGSGGVKGMESRILAMDPGSAAPAGRAESGTAGSESARGRKRTRLKPSHIPFSPMPP